MDARTKTARDRLRPWIRRIGSVIKRIWRVLDAIRKGVLNIVIATLLFGGLFFAVCSDDDVDIPDEAVLVIAPKGSIVEQRRAATNIPFGPTGLGSMPSEVLLRDLLDTIKAAKDDERIRVLYFDLSKLGGAGMSKLAVIDAAIADFKTSGKLVIASGDRYSQAGYHIAARADEVYLHPFGSV